MPEVINFLCLIIRNIYEKVGLQYCMGEVWRLSNITGMLDFSYYWQSRKHLWACIFFSILNWKLLIYQLSLHSPERMAQNSKLQYRRIFFPTLSNSPEEVRLKLKASRTSGNLCGFNNWNVFLLSITKVMRFPEKQNLTII